MKAANRVAYNSGALYIRMVVDTIIMLYSARLVLEALGSSDFGIYSLVIGIVAILAFLNGAMAVSTGRFLSFNLGLGDWKKLNKVFNTILCIHILLAIGIVLVAVIAGFILFENFLKIPLDRLDTAKTVYYIVLCTTFISVVYVPYDSLLQARENLVVEAILGILNSILRLLLAIYLTYSPYDRLIVYVLGLAVFEFSVRLSKQFYCRRYRESRINLKLMTDRNLMKEIGFFAGWNTFGSGCAVLKNQGVAIILNTFHGTVINAAFGIANKVASQLLILSVNIIRAMYPQIVKAEGAGDRKRMLYLSLTLCKFAFFIIGVFAIPILAEMPQLLNIWLKEVPENTVIFCRLAIVAILISVAISGLPVAIQAIGKIKLHEITIGSILLTNLPVGYLLLKLGYPAFSILVSAIVIEFIASMVRVVLLNRIGGLSILDFVKDVFLRISAPVAAATFACLFVIRLMDPSLFRILVTGTVSAVVFAGIAYFIGCDKDDRRRIQGVASSIFSRLRRVKGADEVTAKRSI